jgi:hypothetical protein
LGKAMPNDFRKLFVAGIASRHFTEAKQGQIGNSLFRGLEVIIQGTRVRS